MSDWTTQIVHYDQINDVNYIHKSCLQPAFVKVITLLPFFKGLVELLYYSGNDVIL